MLPLLRRFARFVSPRAQALPRRAPRRRARAHLGVERLEDRAVPALPAIDCGLVSLVPMVVADVSQFGIVERICDAMPTVNFTLDPAADTGPANDLWTDREIVNLVGRTQPNLRVQLLETGATTTADAQGLFKLSDVVLQRGANEFTVRVLDRGGNFGEAFQVIMRNTAPVVKGDGIPSLEVEENSPETVLNLGEFFREVDELSTIVRFDTVRGTFDIELFDNTASRTVANFLNYVGGEYANSIFHRLVQGFVLQGGGFRYDANASSVLPAIPQDPPVVNEFLTSNTRGTIAMAQRGTDPNSATNQFFVNLVNNDGTGGSTNLNTLNGGFTVFGRVLGDGMRVVDDLASIPTPRANDPSVPADTDVFKNIPLIDYTNATQFPSNVQRNNLALLNNVMVVRPHDALTYTITNDNTNLVEAVVRGNQLFLNYRPDEKGEAVITIRATDRNGAFVETRFKVTVKEKL